MQVWSIFSSYFPIILFFFFFYGFFCLLNFHPLFGNVCPANILFSWALFEVIMYMGSHGLI